MPSLPDQYPLRLDTSPRRCAVACCLLLLLTANALLWPLLALRDHLPLPGL